MITIAQLKIIAPNVTAQNAALVIEHLPAVIEMAELNTPKRLAAFLAQTAVESAWFNRTSENLNYSAERLFETFNKYFKDFALAQSYAKKPISIANRVYANRMGNGPESSGDGWRHRGMGWIMSTGKNNQRIACQKLGIDFSKNELLSTYPYAALSAGLYWKENNLNQFADADDFKGLTIEINGGLHSYIDRVNAWKRAKKAMDIQ